MKRLVTNITLLAFALAPLGAEAKLQVEEIQPPHWWAGMTGQTLQLQVYGPGIRDAEVHVDYPGVALDSVARLDGSDNWQYIYLTLSPDVKPGDIKLKWNLDGETTTVDYPLLKRKASKGAKGFSSADVLYLIMPDRFADGNPENNEPSGLKHPVKVERENLNRRQGITPSTISPGGSSRRSKTSFPRN